MRIGKFYFYECANCKHHIIQMTISSGNSLGAKLYSDGRTIGPMLSRPTIITICKKCQNIFWIKKSNPIASCYYEQIEDIDLDNDDFADFLSIDNNFLALTRGLAETPEEEFYIRKQIWWAYNNRIRLYSSPLFSSSEDEERYNSNMRKLLELTIPDDTNKKFMKAELYRNLGEFESCLQMIETIEAGESDNLKGDFIDACANKNKNLFIFSMYSQHDPKW